MNMVEFVSSSFISGEKLEPNVVIEATVVAVKRQEFEDGSIKPVVAVEDGRQVVLNQTRLAALIGAYGPNSANWIGRTIQISRGSTFYAGKPVACVTITPVVAPRIDAEVKKAIGN
jgi:hypothetical protein